LQPYATIEMRVIKANENRPGIAGKRVATYRTIAAALESLERRRPSPGQRCVVALNMTLASKSPDYSEPVPFAESVRPQAELPTIIIDEVSEISTETWERLGEPHDAPLPGVDDLDADGGVDGHVCDAEGPLVPIDGEYKATCSFCGAPQ
jgi:hypothetical protein